MATQEGSTQAPRCFICPHKSQRNLVVCIDGTSNRFGIKNTNIVELCSHITKSNTQRTFYHSGLGVIVNDAGDRLSSLLDMAIGRNLHKIIMTAYRWLSNHYQDGDSIYMFGFSRGAYQVRALAAMIARVGLLLAGNDEQIPTAFKLYSEVDDDDLSLTPSMTKASKKNTESAELVRSFRKAFCHPYVHIHFVGVWDTVSSVGIGRGRTLPSTTTSCDHICYFRHALALDERRVKFSPEYAYGGRSNRSDGNRIKEVWFPGCHSDVGGGNRRNEKLQSGGVSLLWMHNEAVAAGLEMEPTNMAWKIDEQITHSMNHGWWLLELLPLKRLLYNNSDRHTWRPHFGVPRRILPGQKVHVSALFRYNYKPFAKFHINSERWPEPMFWNDATSHQRLQNLSDLWEKDIFGRDPIQTLLDDLKRGQPNLDALDRLALLSNFDICKDVISIYEDAQQVLATFLVNKDRLIRLSTAATFCELGWDWPLDVDNELIKLITEDVTEILKSDEGRRACMYMPSLCKRTGLKERLISNENLKKLVEFCDDTRIVKHIKSSSTVAFHSAQALSVLMKSDVEFAQRLVDIGAVTDLIEALHSNCNPTLVSVVGGLAKYECGRAVMKAGPTVLTLLRLVKKYDDFVAPAAIRVLCSLLPDDELRGGMLHFGVLTTFFDMLDRCSDETKQVTCDALVEFAKHDDVQEVLSRDGYLRKFAKRVQNHVPSKRDGAILALVILGNTQALVRTAVGEAIKAAKTIPVLVARLSQKSTALPAASALARLMRIDDIAVMVSEDESVSRMGIVGMLQNRWFDGRYGEDGLRVLSELLECERLRVAVLNAGAIGVLCEMINSGHYESTHAGLHYLRVIARIDEEGSALPNREALNLVPPVMKALRSSHWKAQRIAMKTLRHLSAEESLRVSIIKGLLELLKDRHAGAILVASTLLGSLATDKSVRKSVSTDETFLNLKDEYERGLKFEDDEEGSGPHSREVYESVEHMIKVIQVPESDEVGAEDQQEVERGWLAPVPYELD